MITRYDGLLPANLHLAQNCLLIQYKVNSDTFFTIFEKPTYRARKLQERITVCRTYVSLDPSVESDQASSIVRPEALRENAISFSPRNLSLLLL